MDIRYAWFIHLEHPWKQERFTLPPYMRAYGFVLDPERTAKNSDQLPVGLTSRWDQTMGEMALDITCAACHTGQLEMNTRSAKYSVRMDGGQAMHDLTRLHAGHFAGSDEVGGFNECPFQVVVYASTDLAHSPVPDHCWTGR